MTVHSMPVRTFLTSFHLRFENTSCEWWSWNLIWLVEFISRKFLSFYSWFMSNDKNLFLPGSRRRENFTLTFFCYFPPCVIYMWVYLMISWRGIYAPQRRTLNQQISQNSNSPGAAQCSHTGRCCQQLWPLTSQVN